jgi:uncharacterized protein
MPNRETPQHTIAVVGGGVAGIVSAYLLQQRHRVVLFEQDARLGGHTHTVTLADGPDAGLPVDTGFIVFNDKTYPNFMRFLDRLGVSWKRSDMSFSCYNMHSGLQYAGTTLSGVFAQRRNLARPAFWAFIAGILRFCSRMRRDLRAGRLNGLSLGAYAARAGFSRMVVEEYVIPMASAIWSTPSDRILEFPAQSFAQFYENHGLLSFKNRPVWFTVTGGSHAYVEAFRRAFGGELCLDTPVARIVREADGVVLTLADGSTRRFDCVVAAAHADQTAAMLADPDPDETRLLGAWRYTANPTVLHTDTTFLPPNRRAWASWNYVLQDRPQSGQAAMLTYHMNRLQSFNASRDYCVTLNPARPVDPDAVIAAMAYDHPLFTADAMASQAGIAALSGRRNTYFAGSYLGYGFHEDAVRSAVAVARCFGIAL